MKFLDKELRIVATQGFDSLYTGLEAALYTKITLQILQKHPVDMLVFEMCGENHFHVKLAGYDFITNKLDETTIAFKTESLHIETFWFKVDDYVDYYVGTFLLPSEY